MKKVVVKLTTGELIMAELVAANSIITVLRRPIQVRLVPVRDENNEFSEHPVISMFCQFTNDEVFEFRSEIIMYVKELFPKMADFYDLQVKEMYDVTITKVTVKPPSETKDFPLDEETPTFDDIVKKNLH